MRRNGYPPWADTVAVTLGPAHVSGVTLTHDVDGYRRLWAWRPDGDLHTVTIEHTRGRWVVTADSPYRRAELILTSRPSDDDMRGLCALAWPPRKRDPK